MAGAEFRAVTELTAAGTLLLVRRFIAVAGHLVGAGCLSHRHTHYRSHARPRQSLCQQGARGQENNGKALHRPQTIYFAESSVN